jgi:hypothetical protein
MIKASDVLKYCGERVESLTGDVLFLGFSYRHDLVNGK